MFLRGDTKFAKSLSPNPFHVVPVGYDTSLDGVIEGQCTGIGLGFVTLLGVGERVLSGGRESIPDAVVLGDRPYHNATMSMA